MPSPQPIRCPACHRRFGGAFIFERHQDRRERCLLAPELRAMGFVRKAGIWRQRGYSSSRLTQLRLFRLGRKRTRAQPWGIRRKQRAPRFSPLAGQRTLFFGRALTVLVLTAAAWVAFPPAQASDSSGQAVWYTDNAGACGVPLAGYYAAHRELPCGTKIRVRHEGRQVIVEVKDRGPYGSGLIDLAPAAFKRLAPLSRGRIWVHLHVLRYGWRLP